MTRKTTTNSKECLGLCKSPSFLRDHGLSSFDSISKQRNYTEQKNPKSCERCEKIFYEYEKWRCPCCKCILKNKGLQSNRRWNDIIE